MVMIRMGVGVGVGGGGGGDDPQSTCPPRQPSPLASMELGCGDCDAGDGGDEGDDYNDEDMVCLLYTSPSPRDRHRSRMPSSA